MILSEVLGTIAVVLLTGVLALLWRHHNNVTEKLRDMKRDIDQLGIKKLPHVTRQAQCLALLEHDLELDRPLPPTRGFAASPDFLYAIAHDVRRHRPTCCVEFGSGVSTLVMARCLQLNGAGTLYSFDHDADWLEHTRELLATYGQLDHVTLIHAPLESMSIDGQETVWYQTKQIPGQGIDFFVIDGPPMNTAPLARHPALHVLAPRLAPNALGYADDTDRADEQECLARWRNAFPTITQITCFFEKGAVKFQCP